MPRDQRTKNDEAMAWVERWYATPDAQPPGYWDELLAEIDARFSHPRRPTLSPVRWPDDFWLTKWSYEVTALYALMETDGRTLDTSPDVQARLARIAWRASE